MTLACFAPDDLPATGFGKSFTGAFMRFHFHSESVPFVSRVMYALCQFLGATIMIKLRPSMRGAYSIVPHCASCSITEFITERPIS